MNKKKKWLPRQQSALLGQKGNLTILSKRDKERNNRRKGENRRNYLSDEHGAGFFYLRKFFKKLSHPKFFDIIPPSTNQKTITKEGTACRPHR